MTSKEQRKLQKRKAREKDVRKETLRQREVLRAPAREEREELRQHKRVKKLIKDLDAFDQHVKEQDLVMAGDNVLSQLEKNVEILKTLEYEHNQELRKKQELNQELESQGYLTLEEKVEASRKIFANPKVGGSAEYKMNYAPKKDTAEVSVVKAQKSEENS